MELLTAQEIENTKLKNDLNNAFMIEEESLSMIGDEEQENISDSTRKEIISKIKKKKRPLFISFTNRTKKYNRKVLEDWFCQNINNPFPNHATKVYLSSISNLSYTQVQNWLINTRKRVYYPMLKKKNCNQKYEKIINKKKKTFWTSELIISLPDPKNKESTMEEELSDVESTHEFGEKCEIKELKITPAVKKDTFKVLYSQEDTCRRCLVKEICLN